ncbi:Flp pilus assembly protein, pilin Flp [Sphingopyxis flava]|uniref:Flp pilus assembly protein, pilin Flp n=1 Tax=Sphingopyxis flava TaxID=1507287 RepID=A0A1T5E1D2_9SPHN|nr:Flp pilus assembly protein, pilin Flp [Sphingopyxis flava]
MRQFCGDFVGESAVKSLTFLCEHGTLGNYNVGRGGAMNMMRGLMRSTRAATAVEYGLILALIFLAASVAVSDVGTKTSSMWNNVAMTAGAVL